MGNQKKEKHRVLHTQKLAIVLAVCAAVLLVFYALKIPGFTEERQTYCGYTEHTEHTDECYAVVETAASQTSAPETSVPETSAPETAAPETVDETAASEAASSEAAETSAESTESVAQTEAPETSAPETAAPTPETSATEEAASETEAERELICTLPIHTHTLACYSNPNAVESEDDWEADFDDVELTGVWADDLVTIAQTQLGYTESTENYEVEEDGTTIKGYTRYGDWYGVPYGDWCAMFVSFCLNYTGIDQEFVPYEAGCAAWIEKLQDYDMYEANYDDDYYTPAKGDIIFFDYENDGHSDHVGIVTGVDVENGIVATIEGNTGNAVAEKTYSLTDATITGYGILPENPYASGYSNAASPMLLALNDDEEVSSFEHNKTIDYLGDGESNPDTTLTGEDYYRLYLDMTGNSQPTDLLIVVDASGSMSKTDMDGGMTRANAIQKFLNGSVSSSTSDGFLSYFMNLNSDNQFAIVEFYGGSISNNSYLRSNSAMDYTHDSSVLQGWTNTNTFVQTPYQTNNGTNYEAGLQRATTLLSQVNDDGHRKVVVFMSDGVPTLFQITSDDVGQSVTYNTRLRTYTLQNSDVGYRWGNGVYAQSYNTTPCIAASKRAVDVFLTENPNVTVYSVGISADIGSTSAEGSQSPEVLQYMAEQTGGSFVSVKTNMSELVEQMHEIFCPTGVTITDNLSKYVRYYGDKPDVLVTMTDDSGNTTVLYQNGAVTSAASGILDSVTYTDADTSATPTGSTGTISANFSSKYRFRLGYKYTLSFNVKATQTAYDELRDSGYNATGDGGTDYGTNKTSSGRSGFYSNSNAVVTYTAGGNLQTETYDMPVIQVKLTTGYRLPDTGSSGITIYIACGLLMMAAALAFTPILKRNVEERIKK